MTVRLALLSALLLATILAALPARAVEWTVCNRSAEDASVAIAYPTAGRSIVSKGWWRVRACGGCAVVYRGNLAARGVWVRAEGAKGGVWQGNNFFCTRQQRFEEPEANRPEAVCRHFGLDSKGFLMQTITADKFTTNLRSRPGGPVCID